MKINSIVKMERSNIYRLDTTKGIKYVWDNPYTKGFAFTSKENYSTYTMDANKVLNFKACDGFDTIESVISYIEKYF